MHRDTITIGETPITILFLAMVLHHNASRYNTYLRSPYTILLLSMALHHNVSRCCQYWRSPYHDNVTINGLTSQRTKVLSLRETPPSQYGYSQRSYITMYHDPITLVLLSMLLYHIVTMYHDALTIGEAAITIIFLSTVLSHNVSQC